MTQQGRPDFVALGLMTSRNWNLGGTPVDVTWNQAPPTTRPDHENWPPLIRKDAADQNFSHNTNDESGVRKPLNVRTPSTCGTVCLKRNIQAYEMNSFINSPEFCTVQEWVFGPSCTLGDLVVMLWHLEGEWTACFHLASEISLPAHVFKPGRFRWNAYLFGD